MEAAELDVALEELETRLERLRALYEQYFMGLEKIEPAIARKDVDRRIYVLRREKIRNTAKRFKLQTIIQRYNTFQQYWQRICREIENGTYKRHLLRAQKNGELLTIAARKRLGKQAFASEAAAAESEPPAPPVAPSQPPSAPPAPAPAPVAPFARPAGSPPLPPRRPPLPSRPADIAGTAPAPVAAPAALAPAPSPPAAGATSAGRPAPPARPAAPKFESLDLDMDFMGDWDPGAHPQPNKPVAASPPKAAPPQKPPAPLAGPPPRVDPLPRPPGTAPRPASFPPAPVATPPRPSSTRPPTAPLVPRAAPPRVPPAPRVPAATQPGIGPPAPQASVRGAAPAPKPALAAAPTSPKAPVPAAPPTAPAPAKAGVPSPTAAVAPPRAPSPSAAQPRPAPTPAAAKPAASVTTGVDDARLRDLHSRLQQAKQQTKEANVSFEGLAKSIRATEAKLREQHKNRKIEFDVVIKDGKAVVKPIVR